MHRKCRMSGDIIISESEGYTMNKNEEKLFEFAYELARELSKLSCDVLDYDTVFLFGKYEISLLEICDLSKDEARERLTINDITIQEKWDNEDIVAFLICEGNLYECVDMYLAYGEEILGEDTETVYDTLYELSDKYGIWFERANGRFDFYWHNS